MSQMPSKDEILQWISDNPTLTSKRDIAKAFGIAIGLLALLQMPLALKLLQDALEVDAVGPLDAEGPRDVALGGLGGVLADPVEDLGF